MAACARYTASVRCDTVGHGLGAVRTRRARACAQLGFRVCTLCTQPSFDSVHCSESLFGSLFMNTVHEVFKKKERKEIK